MRAGSWSFLTSLYQQRTMFGSAWLTRSGDTFRRQEGSSGNPVAVSWARGKGGGASPRGFRHASHEETRERETNNHIGHFLCCNGYVCAPLPASESLSGSLRVSRTTSSNPEPENRPQPGWHQTRHVTNPFFKSRTGLNSWCEFALSRVTRHIYWEPAWIHVRLKTHCTPERITESKSKETIGHQVGYHHLRLNLLSFWKRHFISNCNILIKKRKKSTVIRKTLLLLKL